MRIFKSLTPTQRLFRIILFSFVSILIMFLVPAPFGGVVSAPLTFMAFLHINRFNEEKEE